MTMETSGWLLIGMAALCFVGFTGLSCWLLFLSKKEGNLSVPLTSAALFFVLGITLTVLFGWNGKEILDKEMTLKKIAVSCTKQYVVSKRAGMKSNRIVLN